MEIPVQVGGAKVGTVEVENAEESMMEVFMKICQLPALAGKHFSILFNDVHELQPKQLQEMQVGAHRTTIQIKMKSDSPIITLFEAEYSKSGHYHYHFEETKKKKRLLSSSKTKITQDVDAKVHESLKYSAKNPTGVSLARYEHSIEEIKTNNHNALQ